MFKKPVTISARHKVSGSDRKKLRRTLQTAFSCASEEDILAFLPNKEGQLEVGKVQSSKIQIYFLDDEPIIVDSSSKGDFFPTVYALWKSPALLPAVTVKHPAVTKFVVGGADLMLPGVDASAGIPPMEKGAICAILSPGNSAPLAVGEVAIASSDVYMAAGKGRFLLAMHHYRDCLWALPEKPRVPNEGYYADGVGSLEGGEQELEGFPDSDDIEVDEPGAAEADTAAKLVQSLAVEEAQAGEAGGAAREEGAGEDASMGPFPQDMDGLIRLTFLQVLHTVLEDSMLPLAGGKLWSDYMLPNRPLGSHLDLKKSSFKKVSKFLKSQKDAGLISCKEDKRSNDTVITKVSRGHKDLVAFQPYNLSSEAAPAPAAASSADIAPADGGSAPAVLPLVIEEVFTTGGQKEVGIIFNAVVGPGFKNASYTEAQVYQVVHEYISGNGLPKNHSGQVQLDAYLCDALFKGVLKKGETFPTHLSAAQIEGAFLKRMLPQHRLSRGDIQVLKKGSLPQVVLQVKKRQGHKVTCVSGLEPFLIDARQFAQTVQRRCACSASCAELEGSKHKNCFEVTLQGDKLAQVTNLLLTHFTVPQKFVQGAPAPVKK
mmetsp:Transcript_36954/g.104288  ORF Transcript_36954/g.104288 Transcript_36954/m.104288 type:complete len:601 (-) Transcript_36954:203-2005(-)